MARTSALALYKRALKSSKQHSPVNDTDAVAIEALKACISSLCQTLKITEGTEIGSPAAIAQSGPAADNDGQHKHKRRQVEQRQLQQSTSEQLTVRHSVDLSLDDDGYLLVCALGQLARLYEAQGQVAAAVQLLRRALQVFPSSAQSHLQLGKLLRTTAACEEQLAAAEQHLRAAVASGAAAAAVDGGLAASCSKACKQEVAAGEAAAAALSLLLCQAGRDAEAAEHLRSLGFTYRLSRHVLHYPLLQPPSMPCQPPPPQPTATRNSSGTAATAASDDVCHAVAASGSYLRVFDSALPPQLLAHLQRAYAAGAPFWAAHCYGRVGYFSYAFPLEQSTSGSPVGGSSAPDSCLVQLAEHLRALALPSFPRVACARYAEWWAHCRRHDCGHQLHFDSDDEGQGGVRNPIVSCVVYLSGGVGGPTLVTDQHLGGPLATRGWLAHPTTNRVVVFDGRVLHGVLPGRGPSPRLDPEGATAADAGAAAAGCELWQGLPHRVTLMVALWEDLRIRSYPPGALGASMQQPRCAGAVQAAGGCGGGSACGVGGSGGSSVDGSLCGVQSSGSQQAWVALLAPQPVELGCGAASAREAVPLPVAAVWEQVEPPPGGACHGVQLPPTYDACFQGI